MCMYAVRSVDRNGKPFSDTAIASQAFIMVLAGYETTANTLAFTMYNLARSPACQAKLAAEVDAHPGESSHFECTACCLQNNCQHLQHLGSFTGVPGKAGR